MMMRKSILMVALAAAALFIGTSCDTQVTLDKPNVAYEAVNNGGTLRLTWAAVTDAESYEVTTADSTYTTVESSFSATAPTGTIEVRAVNGKNKSDPAKIDCKVVETEALVLYGQSDPESTHLAGFTFTDSGSAYALSVDSANKASIDFVCDDEYVTPVGLVNAGSYGWWQNTKVNVLKATSTDYDSLDSATAGGFTDLLEIAADSVYVFWLPDSTNWSTGHHFAKAKVLSIEYPSGAPKVTLKVGYQVIGGLRWLVN